MLCYLSRKYYSAPNNCTPITNSTCKPGIYKQLYDAYKNHLEQTYNHHRDALDSIIKDVRTDRRTIHHLKESAAEDYVILSKDHDLLVRVYDDLVSGEKDWLNSQRKKFNDTRIDKKNIPEIQINYIDTVTKLYNLKDKGIFVPDPVVVRPLDTLMQETAIPIAGNDSANNFYFKIIRKNVVNQAIFYRSLHYGTYDYGTLTVPYRYRFAPGKAHIFNQAGKDSTGSALPASDAAVSLAVYFGRKWGHTRFYEDPGMSHNTFSLETALITGPTLISLSSSNIDTTSKYIGAKTGYTYTGPSSMIAWSVGAGAVLEWKTINFGIFLGKDFPLVSKTGWIYADKWWLGFGIGVNLGMFSSGNSVN